MRILFVIVLAAAPLQSADIFAERANGGLTGAPEVAHGGGCRKSSPPGQCCHLRRATGVVHCH